MLGAASLRTSPSGNISISMANELQIIICCDGSIQIQKPNGEVSTLQVLRAAEVIQIENSSPYLDWRSMFSYRQEDKE